MRSFASTRRFGILGCVALSACDAPEPASSPAATESARKPGVPSGSSTPAPSPPPVGSFVMPGRRAPDGGILRPPDSALLDAWVFVKLEQGRSRVNPRWQQVRARDTAPVNMPAGTGWQCRVLPLTLEPMDGDDGAGFAGWLAKRTMQCTSDSWRTSVEGAHVVRIGPDGIREPVNRQGELNLREHHDGVSRPLSIVLRTEDPRRKPTHGVAFTRRRAGAAPSAGPNATASAPSKDPPMSR